MKERDWFIVAGLAAAALYAWYYLDTGDANPLDAVDLSAVTDALGWTDPTNAVDDSTDGSTGTMTISDSALQQLKVLEGLPGTNGAPALTAYPDTGGVLTIGWGHTGSDVYAGETITSDQAEQLLQQDVANAASTISSQVTVPLLQNQFDALVLFIFNVGGGNFDSSTLLKDINAGDFTDAVAQFGRWVYGKVNGAETVLQGLVNRENITAAIFGGSQ